MTADQGRTIVVTGATGLQGRAVSASLLDCGFRVRTLTRSPNSQKARALAAMGAEVVQADMADINTLIPIFKGAYGVFSVQNPLVSGIEGEVKQGRAVGDAAKQAGVQHIVYASAGPDARDTGVPSWESKRVIEAHLKSLALPLTILRPMAFMELMTEKKFFPAVSTWHVMPKLMGGSRRVPWLSVDDVGVIAAKAFSDPDRFIGLEIPLASDIQTIDDCREIYRSVMGKNPPRFPMPVGMFERFGLVGKDLGTMWRWLRHATFPMETDTVRQLHPDALRVQTWLEKQKRLLQAGAGTSA